MTYYLQDGTEVTKNDIEKAFKNGDAILIHARRLDGTTSSALMLNGVEFDTRNECYSMWEEVWTRKPKSLTEALRAAS